MSDSRTKNTIRNISTGLINRLISIILPFINRTAIIWTLGAEFSGLTSLLTSILHVLNLAELGFNTAIVYSLYKPMADKDEKRICEIVSLFKKIYAIVGTIILIIGLILLPFIPYLIKDSYPNAINIYFLYLLYLINTVISYYLFAYRECLLIADQRRDISQNIRTIISILVYGAQLLVLLLFKNLYMYLFVSIIGTIITNLFIAIFTRKRYPFYKTINVNLKMPKELKKQVSGLMINKMCDTFRNSFDSLIISSTIGLTATAIYSNYYYIYSALYSIMIAICSGMSASIGNSIVKKEEVENYNDMLSFSWIFAWILGITTVCLGVLYQSFMELWVGKDLLLSDINMFLFVLYYYVININNIRNQYISGTGLWWKVKTSYIIEAVANLLLNIILGKVLGITGVLLATIITIFFLNYIQRNRILFKNYFKNENVGTFYKEQLYYFVLTLVSFVISYYLCGFVIYVGVYNVILRGIIGFIVSTTILSVGLLTMKRYKETKKMILNIKNNLLRKKYKHNEL